MASPHLMRLEAAIDRLPLPDQLWLMERLARRLRDRHLLVARSPECELEAMAKDPEIQRELREIEVEFASPPTEEPWANGSLPGSRNP